MLDLDATALLAQHALIDWPSGYSVCAVLWHHMLALSNERTSETETVSSGNHPRF